MKRYFLAVLKNIVPPPKKAAELFFCYFLSTVSMIIALVTYSLIVGKLFPTH